MTDSDDSPTSQVILDLSRQVREQQCMIAVLIERPDGFAFRPMTRHGNNVYVPPEHVKLARAVGCSISDYAKRHGPEG